MKCSHSSSRPPDAADQALLHAGRVVPLTEPEPRRRFQQRLRQHHYLGGLKAVGEQMYDVAVDAQGHWLALLLFSAAARHLKHHDQWIGWSRKQRERRLALDRLSADWQARYGHPVLVVETFVDPEQFSGTVYTAQGRQELGLTDGWGRCRRDYYVQHDRPKRLFVREISCQARRSLQAEHLKAASRPPASPPFPACCPGWTPGGSIRCCWTFKPRCAARRRPAN